MFKLKAPFKPTGDQPQAIEKLIKNLKMKEAAKNLDFERAAQIKNLIKKMG